MNNSAIFLEIAERDLIAAKCLYKEELYPQAIFYLQQSVEKIMKAFGTLSSDLSIDVLKAKVGHRPFNIFTISMEQFLETFESKTGLSTPMAISAIFKKKEKDFINELKKADKIYHELAKIDELSDFMIHTQLTDILDEIKNIDVKHDYDNDTKEFIDSTNFFLIEQFGKKYGDVIDKFCDLMKEHIGSFMHIMKPLAFLVMILPASCVQNSRYPTVNSNPLELYTKSHLIVKNFRKVVKICDFVSKHIDSLFKMFIEISRIAEESKL